MKKQTKFFILFALAFGLVACTTDDTPTSNPETPDTEEEVGEPEPNTPEETDPVTFDDEIEDTIEIEGMEEPMVLKLYDHPDAPFLTYYPEDLLVEETSSGEGDAYTFYANYEGTKNEEVYLEIYFFADHVTEEPSPEDADSTFAQRLEGMEEVDSATKWHEWSIKEFQTADASDHALLGEHEGQYFMMIVQSEPLYSEGFIPRVDKIIQHFYWKDTNQYLVDES